MKIYNVCLFILLAVGLSGCAAMIEASCKPNAAYSAGINDAQNNRDMQSDYASLCPIEKKAAINRAYRSGYTEGMRHRKPLPKPEPEHKEHKRYPHRYLTS